jgi:uncharacterized protein (DUF488 family)
MADRVVFSIGYERRTPQELAVLLQNRGVRRLLDVRELPLSRRRGFSKTALSDLLERTGIAYRHLRYAGNPHRALKADIETCLRLYASYLDEALDVVPMVQEELLEGRVAVLCYERDHASCHRSVLLERVRQSGLRFKIVEVT